MLISSGKVEIHWIHFKNAIFKNEIKNDKWLCITVFCTVHCLVSTEYIRWEGEIKRTNHCAQ